MEISTRYPPRLELFRRALKPLVRTCLRGQHTLQEVIDVLKLVFVEVGVEELKRSTNKINTSRISVLTGVHRKDVTRIFREGTTDLKQTAPLLARVLGQWEQDSRFSTRTGKPRILSWEGEKSEFAELVRSVTDDVRAGTVLFELERSGVAQKLPRGLKLVRPTLPVNIDIQSRWDFLARNIETLVRAAEQNLFSPLETPNLHIRTEYDRISEKHLPIVRRWLHRSGKAFHKKVRAFLANYDADVNASMMGKNGENPTNGRVVLTSFSYTEDSTA